MLAVNGLRIEGRFGITIYYHNGGDDCHFLPFGGGFIPCMGESQIRHF